ncbi:MAG: TraB/GumN family protein [Pseudomonadota bacterium]
MKRLLITLGSLLATAFTANARGDSDGLVWAIDGDRNTVYLAGSIHLLRKSDYPLPGSLAFAYEDAEALLMELDMDDLNPMAMASKMMSAGRAAESQSLSVVLGDQYDEAQALASQINVDLKRLDSVQPWLAAMTITQIAMMSRGFDPSAGVEIHFTQAAGEDGKPIEGLETLDEQIDALATMDMDDQVDFLMMTLSDMDELDGMINTMVDAWRDGDVDRMIEDLVEPMGENPDVTEAMLLNRNRNWIETIEAQLQRDDDVMILVGAAHLVGDGSVNDLLTQKGYTLRRVTSPR